MLFGLYLDSMLLQSL